MMLILTDLDGCLVSPEDPSARGAAPALERLRKIGAIVCFVTTKTATEIQLLQKDLGWAAPAAIEGGAAIVVPRSPKSKGRGAVFALAKPKRRWMPQFEEMLARFHAARPMSQISDRELTGLTGLRGARLAAARDRDFGDPVFFPPGETRARERFVAACKQKRWSVELGGTFVHVLAGSDKGRAARILVSRMLRSPRASKLRVPAGSADSKLTIRISSSGARAWTIPARPTRRATRVIAIGDSPLDLPFLRLADRAVVIPKPGGRPDPAVRRALPNAKLARRAGPEGWSKAMMEILDELGL
jgi:mannosyl-3-phosphoglycerate phosphatase